jgi:hypothetical protein
MIASVGAGIILEVDGSTGRMISQRAEFINLGADVTVS